MQITNKKYQLWGTSMWIQFWFVLESRPKDKNKKKVLNGFSVLTKFALKAECARETDDLQKLKII